MSKKELSQYPPDKWIREVNRRYPNLWTDLRKVYENPSKMIRSNSGGIELLQSVPDWCIMPTFFPFLVITNKYGELFYMTHMDELMTLGSTYIWRCSKGIYRFAPEIYQALISQPLTGDLPMECLHHLPEWAVYVETPGLSYERHPMEGYNDKLTVDASAISYELKPVIESGTHPARKWSWPNRRWYGYCTGPVFVWLLGQHTKDRTQGAAVPGF